MDGSRYQGDVSPRRSCNTILVDEGKERKMNIEDAVEKDQLCICLLLYLAIHSCMYQRRLRVQYVLYIYRYIEEHVQRTGVAIETQGFSFVTSGRRRESLTVHMSYLCF